MQRYPVIMASTRHTHTGPGSHRSGLPGSTERRCATCTWSVGQGSSLACVAAAGEGEEPRPIGDGPGCAHYEDEVDCLTCGACCREAFDSVPIEPGEVAALPGSMVRHHDDGWIDMQRVPSPLGRGTRCAALCGAVGGEPFTCVVYAERPNTCRDLTLGSDACLTARRRVGLSAWAPGQTPAGPLFSD